MEDKLNFNLMLSLEELALRSVAVILWKQRNILDLFQQRSFPPSHQKFRGSNILSKDACPKSLKEKIRNIDIDSQVNKWKCFHKRYLEKPGGWREILAKYFIDSHVKLDEAILVKLCFTATGTIDYRKTAQELIHCKLLDVVKRYKLACLYCLEGCIHSLWEEIPDEIRSMFCNEDTLLVHEMDLQFCWSWIVEGELSFLDDIASDYYGYPTTFYQHAYGYFVQEGNKSAAKYFWGKLSTEVKNASLAAIELNFVDTSENNNLWRSSLIRGKFPWENQSDFLCYLLSQMNREQQMEVFKENSCNFLTFFLDWPWRDLFFRIADHIWVFLSEENYEYLFQQVYRRLPASYCFFAKFFQDFFPRSPVNFRKDFVDKECEKSLYLFKFFRLEDSESVKIMFRNLSAADRMRIVSSKICFELLHNNILRNRMNVVKVCLQEARLSKEDREKIKVAFVAFGVANKERIKLQSLVQNQLFKLLDQFYGGNKRSFVDDTLRGSECTGLKIQKLPEYCLEI